MTVPTGAIDRHVVYTIEPIEGRFADPASGWLAHVRSVVGHAR